MSVPVTPLLPAIQTRKTSCKQRQVQQSLIATKLDRVTRLTSKQASLPQSFKSEGSRASIARPNRRQHGIGMTLLLSRKYSWKHPERDVVACMRCHNGAWTLTRHPPWGTQALCCLRLFRPRSTTRFKTPVPMCIAPNYLSYISLAHKATSKVTYASIAFMHCSSLRPKLGDFDSGDVSLALEIGTS